MARPNLRLLGLVTLFLLVPGASSASPPSSTSGSESNPGSPAVAPDPRVDEYQSLGISRRLTLFSGTVLDVNDHPVPGVEVKLFVDGAPIGAAVTEGNGYYDLRAPYDPTADATVLLWFMAPDHTLMPKMLVLQESRACKEQSVISACVPRATVTPGRQFRVYLFDPQTRNKELSELDCLP